MGLREKKAQRSRERIIAEAVALFSRNGYQETTMETIAEAADLSPSTLYRYFATKDSIVIASFTTNTAKFAEVFSLRVKEMTVERALAEGIFAVLAIEDENPRHALLVRSILGQSLAARARLWEYLREQQKLIAAQLAAALKLPGDDPRLILTARVAVEVMLASADIWRASKGRVSSRATATQLMHLLRGGAVIFPDPGLDETARPAAKATPRKLATKRN